MGTYFLKRFSLSSQRESYSFHGFLTAENFSRIVDIYFRSKSRCWRGGDGHCIRVLPLNGLITSRPTWHLQCPPPPLDRSVTVKGLKSGNFNSNFYSFVMASETLGIGLRRV